MARRWLLIVISLLVFAGPLAAAEPQPYMRIDRARGDVSLQVAIRRLAPAAGQGPVIHLVGVIHLGDAEYYQNIQQQLNGQSLVLYEAVGQPDFVRRDHADDDEAADNTRMAMLFIDTFVKRYRQRHGAAPATLGLLLQEARQHNRLEAAWLRAALRDAWDRPLRYERQDRNVVYRSAGPDGNLETDDDVHLTGTPRHLPDAAKPELQADVARALGLAFQLDVIDYDRPNFRNSDMTLEQLQRVMAGRPVDGDEPDEPQPDGDGDAEAPAADDNAELRQMMKMLGGESAMSRLVSAAMRFVGSSPKLRSIVKLMLIEMIGRIEGDMSRMGGMPPEMQRMMQVLIRDRNDIVVKDLTEVVRSDDPPATIAVFYGAGHMADLERRICQELGYAPAGDDWLTAFSVKPADTGLSEAELKIMRAVITAQMKAMHGEKD